MPESSAGRCSSLLRLGNGHLWTAWVAGWDASLAGFVPPQMADDPDEDRQERQAGRHRHPHQHVVANVQAAIASSVASSSQVIARMLAHTRPRSMP